MKLASATCRGYTAHIRGLIYLLFFVVVGAFIRVALADDQIRVMVVFDESGHRVEQVFRSANRSAALPRTQANARLKSGTSKSGQPYVAWYSAEGTMLVQNHLVEPRVKHVPLQGSASRLNPVRYAALTSGVYLIAGPADAAQAIITLPLLNTGPVRLPAEQWTLDLNVYP